MEFNEHLEIVEQAAYMGKMISPHFFVANLLQYFFCFRWLIPKIGLFGLALFEFEFGQFTFDVKDASSAHPGAHQVKSLGLDLSCRQK
jgi:hypothetical protein